MSQLHKRLTNDQINVLPGVAGAIVLTLNACCGGPNSHQYLYR